MATGPGNKAGNKEREQGSPSLLERIVRPASWLGASAAVILVLTMLTVVSYSVFMRYVLGTPVTWTDELSGYLVIGVVMFGAAESLLKGDHFGVDLLTSKLSGSKMRLVTIWGLVTVAIIGAAILYSADIMVRFSLNFGMYSEGYLETPMWIPQMALVIGSILLIAAAIARISSHLKNRRNS